MSDERAWLDRGLLVSVLTSVKQKVEIEEKQRVVFYRSKQLLTSKDFPFDADLVTSLLVHTNVCNI